MADWYYKLMGEVVGPFSKPDLIAQLQRQNAPPDTFVREGDNGDWITADRILDLASTTPRAIDGREKTSLASKSPRKRLILIGVGIVVFVGVLAWNFASRSPTPVQEIYTDTGTSTDEPLADQRNVPTETRRPAYRSADGRLIARQILPRPIQSPEDRQRCLSAAREFDRELLEMTGIPNSSTTEQLDDCIVQYDTDETPGYIKYFPDGERVRMDIRNHADANLNVGPTEIDIHLDISQYDVSAYLRNHETGERVAFLKLERSLVDGSYARDGSWDVFVDPDVFQAFCESVHREFLELR